MAGNVIHTEGLTKHYGKVVGVEGLDLEVSEGEVFGFLGPNGAGKTTTLRLLMGLLRPTSGRALVFGLDTWKESVSVKAKTGYQPGEEALYLRMTGIAHVKFIAGFRGNGSKEGEALASRLELDLTRKVSGYSRGMKQKLALVLALMNKPPLLLMDEPTSSLDPITQYELYEVLSEYRQSGTTVLFSSHNLPEVERICDRVGIIRDGQLVGTESIEDMRSKRLRNVEIIFEGEAPSGLDTIPGVTNFQRSGSRVRLDLKGDINLLIKRIAEYEVADVSVSHASLEDVFLEFYGQGGAGGAA